MVTARTRRAKAAAANAQARYDAAGSGRRLAGWRPPSAGPNRALVGLGKVRDRARDAIRNDWAGESSIQKWVTTLIGVGIVQRWTDDAITTLYRDWCKVCDADSVLDMAGLQALLTRALMGDGEVFIRRRYRSPTLNLPVPLQIQLIESEFCPLLDAESWPGLPTGNRIRQGIELNRWGARTAIWFHKEHPNDFAGRISADDLVRVPIKDVAHVFEVKRPGQLRGISSLAAILIRLRSTGDFEDAVLDRQKLANLFTMFIQRAMPSSWADIEVDPDTGLPKWYADDGLPMVGLEPGMSQELKPGESVQFANPPEAGVSYPDYLRSTQLGTAAGQGLPYELFSGDIANVSDRTLRVVIQEFRRLAEQRQWITLIPMACRPMVEWFAISAVVSGKLPARKLSAAMNPYHQPHGWEYIHPVQDVEGKIKAIEANLTSRSAVISARGDDPNTVADDIKKDKALGLVPEPPAVPTPGPAPAAGKPQPQQYDMAPIMAAMGQMMASMQAIIGGFQAMQATQVAPVAQAPVIHNHLPAPIVNVAPTTVEVTNEVHPTPVNVEVAPAAVSITNEVQPTPVSVAVEPSIVNITNEVQPAEVNVNLPARKTESVITRDRHGDITNVVQTERDLLN